MTRIEQEHINARCYYHFNTAIEQLRKEQLEGIADCKQLLTCQAWVWETEDYYILQSYKTFIACIEKKTDTLYDVLRTEYGYTNTSSKHIAKFRKGSAYGGYGAGAWGVAEEYTARIY